MSSGKGVNMASKKIWISRDLDESSSNEMYFWSKKPNWDEKEECYECSDSKCGCNSCECCHTEITNVSIDCSECRDIMDSLGLDLCPGELAEFSLDVKVSTPVTLASQAKELRIRLNSKKKPSTKELMEFLNNF